MADLLNLTDGLRVYLTGAAYAAGYQNDVDASLGGYRSSVEHAGLAVRRSGLPIYGLQVLHACGQNSPGAGTIQAVTADSVTWTPPGDTVGSAVTIAVGETKILQGADTSKYLRVKRTESTPLSGIEAVTLLDVVRNEMGPTAFSEAESTSGAVRYRCLMLKNESDVVIGVQPYIRGYENREASNGVLADVSQLPATGAGTIESSTDISAWPQHGYLWVFSDTTTTNYLSEVVPALLKEIVYHERSGQVLNVSSTHRGLLGTAATGGIPNQWIIPAPGLRYAVEAPVAGAVQTIVNETTAPIGLTWNNRLFLRTSGGTIVGLDPGEEVGLWIELNVVSGHKANAEYLSAMFLGLDIAPVTLRNTLRGVTHVAEDGMDRYELFHAAGTDPVNDSVPVATSETAPFEWADPLTDGMHKFVTRKRSRYGLLSENKEVTPIEVLADGSIGYGVPSPPSHVAVDAIPTQQLRIQAIYNALRDADDAKADQFVIWVTADESIPIITDLPLAIVDIRDYSTPGIKHLAYAIDNTYLDGTPLLVAVATRRTIGLGAPATSEFQYTSIFIGRQGPTRPLGGAFYQFARAQHWRRPDAPTDPYVIDAVNNIRFDIGPNSVAFYADTLLVWRVVYDSNGTGVLYFPSVWDLQNGAVAGAGSGDPIEVASWTGLDKTLYVNVNGVRRMQIDVLNTTITYVERKQDAALAAMGAPQAIWPRYGETVFQIWRTDTAQWEPYMDIDSVATWTLPIDFRQNLNQAAIEALVA